MLLLLQFFTFLCVAQKVFFETEAASPQLFLKTKGEAHVFVSRPIFRCNQDPLPGSTGSDQYTDNQDFRRSGKDRRTESERCQGIAGRVGRYCSAIRIHQGSARTAGTGASTSATDS